MANKWVYLATVCSCALVTGWAASARGQDAIESAAVEQPAPSEVQDNAAPSDTAPSDTAPHNDSVPTGETVGEATSTALEVAPSLGAELPTEAASAQALPSQAGGFVQRLSDRLNGGNPVRVPVPAANRDPRVDLLDTSFPAEQPEIVEPEPDLGSNPNSKRTQARTINGITEISNRADLPVAEPVSALTRASAEKTALSRPQVNTEVNNPRLDSQISLPATSIARTTSRTSPWLWVLAGTAMLLLVPIAFLLTRPTR